MPTEVPGLLVELVDILLRGFRLRCPCCGYGELFESLTSIRERCSGCDERFEREPGQWFGSIYINLVLTLGVAVTGYLVLESLTSLTTSQQLNIWTTIAVTAPFVFYRISKGLWVSMIFLGEGLYIRWPHSTGQTDFNGRSSGQTQDRIARILKLPSVR